MAEPQLPGMVADGAMAFGDGMRDLPERYKSELLRLVRLFEARSSQARREYVRKCLKLHEFFRGNQWGYWDYNTGAWTTTVGPGGLTAGQQSDNQPQSLYALNFFQGFMLSIIAVMTGNRPTVKFFPEDPDNPDDVARAKMDDVVMRAFERLDGAHKQFVKTIYLLCTDGSIGTFIRHVVDGERFGWLHEPEFQDVPQKMGEDRWQCPICAQVYPTREPGLCAECGAPLPEMPNVPAPMVPVPTIVGYKKIPKGRTVRSVVGGLELHLPPLAEAMEEFPYLIRQRELDKGIVRATWPEIADQVAQLDKSYEDWDGSGTYEKMARRQAAQGTTVDNRTIIRDVGDQVTLSECWLRPSAFYNIDDPVLRQELLSIFEGGCKVTFANDVFCEARPESMDDHWRIHHALPGRGQVREPIFGSLVQIQELANDIVNIIRDIIEYTTPMVFADQQVFDIRRIGRGQVLGGGMYPVTGRSGQSVSEAFYQTQPGRLPEYVTVFLEQLRTTWAQFATGAFPSIYGGGTGGNNTAQGIAAEQSAAMGRISLILNGLREHYTDWAPLVIEDFKLNSLDPATDFKRGQGGQLEKTQVEPEDLDVGESVTIPEFDDQYPTTWAQRQALIAQMFANPAWAGTLALLKNAAQVKSDVGTTLEIPGEAAYTLQFKIIDELLAGQPVQMPDGTMAASVMPNPLDNNQAMLEACVDFYFSERGQSEMKMNQVGWENFMLHVQARQFALAPPPAPAPQGNEGQAPSQEPAPAEQSAVQVQ